MAKKSVKANETKINGEGTAEQDGLFELICSRAYEIYRERGCSHGNDLQDWLQAEAEVRARLAQQTGKNL